MSWATWPVKPQIGTLAAAAITATTAGTANALVAAVDHETRLVVVGNTLNQDCMLTLNGADFAPLLAGQPVVLDLGSNRLHLPATAAAGTASVLGAYNLGVAPTTGRVVVALQ